MSKRNTAFYATCEGKLYVRANAIMHPMCAMLDGLPMSTFKGDKAIYLDIQTAIDWCRKEMAYSPDKDKYVALVAAMEAAKARAAAPAASRPA